MNVNGLRDDLKRDMIFDYLSRRKFNIVFLQESHSVCDDDILGVVNGRKKYTLVMESAILAVWQS